MTNKTSTANRPMTRTNEENPTPSVQLFRRFTTNKGNGDNILSPTDEFRKVSEITTVGNPEIMKYRGQPHEVIRVKGHDGYTKADHPATQLPKSSDPHGEHTFVLLNELRAAEKEAAKKREAQTPNDVTTKSPSKKKQAK